VPARFLRKNCLPADAMYYILSMEITNAGREDLPEILQLQKLAYQSEAELLDDYAIQPMVQTLRESEEEFDGGIVLKLTDGGDNRIVGSVRASEKGGRVYVAKLMVHPDYQNRGLGARLLAAIEALYGGKTFELYTTSRSGRNLYLYKKCGYREFKRESVTPCAAAKDYEFIFLEK